MGALRRAEAIEEGALDQGFGWYMEGDLERVRGVCTCGRHWLLAKTTVSMSPGGSSEGREEAKV